MDVLSQRHLLSFPSILFKMGGKMVFSNHAKREQLPITVLTESGAICLTAR